MRKIRLGLVCGGSSAEHEVSLLSAKNIVEGLDKHKYDIFLIGINKKGEWYIYEASSFLCHADSVEQVHLSVSQESIAIRTRSNESRFVLDTGSSMLRAFDLDVLFPILHGSQGEDGSLQGLLKLIDLPFVGAGVLGSAVGMDKDVMKRLLRDAGVPVGQFLTVRKESQSAFPFERVTAALGLPFFVKPANAGSSVGICKVKQQSDYAPALAEAFLYDRKVLLEEFIEGRELECAVLGNAEPVASLPGEIVPHHEFYSYEAKYIDPEGATCYIPALVDDACIRKVQQIALEAYQVLCCAGMARLDFFLKADGSLWVNEINTLPGFTSVSMYPKLWQASGVGYTELLDRLISLAQERHAEEKALQTSYQSPRVSTHP